jgi:hypothetical protein
MVLWMAGLIAIRHCACLWYFCPQFAALTVIYLRKILTSFFSEKVTIMTHRKKAQNDVTRQMLRCAFGYGQIGYQLRAVPMLETTYSFYVY